MSLRDFLNDEQRGGHDETPTPVAGPANTPRCKTCGHVEEAHFGGNGESCMYVVARGRNMETDDDFCECTEFVPRPADAVRPYTTLAEIEELERFYRSRIETEYFMDNVSADDLERLLATARASVEAQEDAVTGLVVRTRGSEAIIVVDQANNPLCSGWAVTIRRTLSSGQR